MASDGTTRWIALVAFSELTLLDLVGPLQVFRGLEAPFQTAVVAERLEPILTDTGLRITPQMTFADIPRPDVIVIPGGPGLWPRWRTARYRHISKASLRPQL